MAFDAAKITKISNLLSLPASTAPTPGLFVYDTPDNRAAVLAAGYFDAYAKFLEPNCLIDAYCADGKLSLKVDAVSAAGVVTFHQVGSFSAVNPAGGAIRFVAGQKLSVTAADTVVTGLTTVLGVVASLDADPTDNPEWVTATIGDQAGAPAAGSIILKTWQNTAGNDPTPTAATTFGKKINWIAYGT